MPVVLEISSDEEEGLERGPDVPDFDWIKEFLFTSDEESDDSDDVFIVHETKPELKKSKPSTFAVKDNEDDDDCVVLEGDPENGVTSVNEEETDSDELLVVGEKGQVACRDYPHARHLCAKFPFASTPHERHCSQCHCFVCDCLAPCLKWGTGILSSDHCHANDKTEVWKIQRKNFKQGKSSPLPASTNYSTSLQAVHLQHFEIEPPDIIRRNPNSLLQSQASRSTAIRTCSSLNSVHQIQASQTTAVSSLSPLPNPSVQNQVSRSINVPGYSTITNSRISNGANIGRCHESRYILGRNRCRPHSIPTQVLGVRHHSIQRDKGSGPSSLGPQFLRPHVMSKGVGFTGVSPTVNNSSRGSSGFNNHAPQCDKYHTGTRFLNYRSRNGPDDAGHHINLSVYSQPSSEPVSYQHTVAPQTQVYSQPLSSPLCDSCDFYQPCIHGNDACPNCVACLNSNLSNQHGNENLVRSQDKNAGGNIPQCVIAIQDTCQSEPHEENPSETGGKKSAFESSWTENIGQTIEIEPPTDCSVQSSGPTDQPSSVKDSGTRFTGSTEPPIEFFHLPGEFENWILEKDSVPVVTDGIFPSELNNIPSPDYPPIDTGWW